MSEEEPNGAAREHNVNAFGTDVYLDGHDWCVTAMIDGQRRVVSRHASEERAQQASRHLNASANRGPGDAQP